MEFYNRNWRVPSSWNGTEDNNNKVSNYSMSFDGSSEYIETGLNLAYTTHPNITLSCWVKMDKSNLSTFTSYSALGVRSSAFQNGSPIRILTNGTKQAFVAIQGQGGTTQSTTDLSDGNWHSVILTSVYDSGGTIQNVFINGVSEISNKLLISYAPLTGSLYIGVRDEFLAQYYNGQLDQVAIFDYALTDGTGGTTNQIAELYGSSSTGVGNPMAITNGRKPVAYYPLGDYSAFNGSNYLVANSALSDYVFDFIPNDYVDLGNNATLYPSTSDVSYSAWINPDSTTGFNAIFGVQSLSTASKGVNIQVYNGEIWVFVAVGVSGQWGVNTGGSTGGGGFITSSANLTLNIWHHIAFTFDRDGNGVIYINGVPNRTAAVNPNNYSSVDITSTASVFLGRGDGYFDGKISNAAIFNTALPATGTESVQSLYNYGTPPDISSYSGLQGFWKLDAGSTFDGSNWTVPDESSNSNNGTSSGMTAANLVQSNLNILSPYSRYALSYDGTNDKITLNSSINTGDNYSVSFWLNPSTTGPGMGNSYIFSDSTTSPFKGLALDQGSFTAGGFGNFYYYTGAVNIVSNTAILGNVWSNIVITFDFTGQEIKFYVNGVLDKTSTSVANIGTLINEFGIRSSGNPYNGNLSNISIWNAGLTSAQVSEIYNEGKPSNLNNHSAYSNLVSWWQLGENSSFNSNWTVIDEKGTNNGTSVNMAEDDLVDGVGTTANGLSSGMGGADNIVGNAPFSNSNALSYSMGADAKSTSVPT